MRTEELRVSDEVCSYGAGEDLEFCDGEGVGLREAVRGGLVAFI